MIRSEEELDLVIVEAFCLLQKRERTSDEEVRLLKIGDMIQQYETGRMTNAVRACLEGAVSVN
jgi:hypothetical protein